MAPEDLAKVAVKQLRAIDEGERSATLEELLSKHRMASR